MATNRKSKESLKLLLVEDNQADYVYLWELLKEINSRAAREHWSFFGVAEMQMVWVKTLAEAVTQLSQNRFDVVLLDLSLPDSDGIDSVNGIIAKSVNLPVIVLSGDGRAELTFEAVTSGAQDFLVKGQFNSDQLARSIRYSVERKRIERELDQASRHKSQFLANMSHELRTPITSILGFSEIVLEELQDHPVLNHSAGAVVRNAKHLLALLDDILDYSKIEAGKLILEKVDVPLAQLIGQVYSMVKLQAEAKELDLLVEGSTPIPQVIVGDPLRIRQILLNLLTNAIKFTERGRISLKANYNTESGLLSLAIEDSGIGISEEKQKILFQPFTQADPSNARQFGGSGLGLSITRRLAQMMNGDVTLVSREGSGSTFTFILPVNSTQLLDLNVAMEQERSQQEVAPPRMQLHGKVLLVEDTKDSRELIKLILSRAGAIVETASNGHEAVTKASNGDFDLILMDMHMPLLDGYEATRILRQQGFTRSIVALTARVTEDAEKACKDAGCDDYISKPIKRHEFFKTLFKYLQGGTITIAENSGNSLPSQALLSEAAALVDEDEETQKIIKSYVESLPVKLALITDALNRHDWTALKNEAHKLANAEMFGFPQITQYARRIEKAAKDSKYTDAMTNLNDLNACVKGVSE